MHICRKFSFVISKTYCKEDQQHTVFILLQSAGSISWKHKFAVSLIGNLLNTTAGSIGGAGSIRMRIVLE